MIGVNIVYVLHAYLRCLLLTIFVFLLYIFFFSFPQKKPAKEAPYSPDLFGDSFNDHDSFFEKIDIVEIEKKASQDNTDSESTKCDKQKNLNKCLNNPTSPVSSTNPERTRKRKCSLSQEVVHIKQKSPKESVGNFFASDSEDILISNLDIEKLSQKADQILENLNKIQQSQTSRKSNQDLLINQKPKAVTSTKNHENIQGNVNERTTPLLTEARTLEIPNRATTTDSLKTPGSASSRLSRLKKTLQKNATTPQNQQRLQQYREEQVENAIKDAKVIQVSSKSPGI